MRIHNDVEIDYFHGIRLSFLYGYDHQRQRQKRAEEGIDEKTPP